MIIKSLEIKNFKSYRGVNKIQFKKGLNIISGSIGSGKTSLYESFQWLIEERNNQYIDLAFVPNLGVVNECVESKSSFEVSVLLEFDNNGKDCALRKVFEYEIKNLSPVLKNEHYYYSYINKTTNETIIDDNTQSVKRKIAKEIFPQQIREYILFKGENLDNLIDFANPNTLKSAVDRISYLKYYESISTNTELLLSKLQIKLDRKIKVDKKNQTELNNITHEINRINEFELPRNQKEEDKVKKDIEELKAYKTRLFDTIKSNGDFPELKAKYELTKAKLAKVLDDISSFDLNLKNTYLTGLMVYGQDEALKKCEKEFKKYFDSKQKEIQEGKAVLEIGIPGDEHIHEMLEKCECKICGHKFEKFSKEYKMVEGHLDSKKLDLKKLISDEEREFEKGIDDFRNSIPVLKKKVNYSKQYFESLVERKQKLEQKRNLYKDDLDSLSDKIGELLKKNPNLDDSRNSGQLENEFKRVENDLKRKETTKNNLNINNINLKNRLTKLNFEKTKLSSNPEELTSSSENQAMKYVEFLNELSRDQIEKEKITFIKNIEKNSNNIQENIIKSGTASNLVVLYSKIDPNDLSIDFIDIDGNPNPGHGAQLTLSKLSIISSVLNLSNEKVDEVFPFIVDAPTSDFDDTIYEPYIESLSSNLVQSIVILKDINNDIDSYKNKSYVDTLYKIEKKLLSDGKSTMENSYTTINKIK